MRMSVKERRCLASNTPTPPVARETSLIISSMSIDDPYPMSSLGKSNALTPTGVVGGYEQHAKV